MTTKVFDFHYNRKSVTAGILHIGVGNFPRAHEEFFTKKQSFFCNRLVDKT